MRALVLDYQDDKNVYETGDQYLFGSDLMVCPVTTKGAQTRTVYLPEGEWYDWWTGKKYSGRQYVHVLTPLDTMPIFAKAGAVIPMQPAMNYVGEKPVEEITLDVFPGGNSSFELYEDDGESLGYQQQQYSTTKISGSGTAKGFSLKIAKPDGKFIPATHRYRIILHGNEKPRQVLENGVLMNSDSWTFGKATGLEIRIKGTNSVTVEIVVNY